MKLNTKIIKRVTQLLNDRGYKIIEGFHNDVYNYKISDELLNVGYVKVELNDDMDIIKLNFQMINVKPIYASLNKP